MKALKISYYISTGLVVLGMAASSASYFFVPLVKDSFTHTGFPDWFRIELGLAKALGVLALGIPAVPARIKEWAYVGFAIDFFSAFLAHYETRDPLLWQMRPLIILVVLIISYITYHQAILKKNCSGDVKWKMVS